MDARAERLFGLARAVATGSARFPRKYMPRPMEAMLSGTLGGLGDASTLTDMNEGDNPFVTPPPASLDPGALTFSPPATTFPSASESGAASQSGGNVFMPNPQYQSDALNPGTLTPPANQWSPAPYSSGVAPPPFPSTGISPPPLVQAPGSPNSGGGFPSLLTNLFSSPSNAFRTSPYPIQTGPNPVMVVALLGAAVAVVAAIMYSGKKPA